MSDYTVSVLPNRGDEYDLDGPFSLDAAFTAAAAAYARTDCRAVHVRDARTGELVREYSSIGSHGGEAVKSHPGGDTLTVIYPGLTVMPPDGTDLLAWCETHRPPVRTAEVTRDEFQRRMAGNPVLDQLHEAGPDTRVISLMEPTALAQWLATSGEKSGTEGSRTP